MRYNVTFWSLTPLVPVLAVMPIVLSMAPLHSLGQDNSNEVQHDLFGHVTLLVLASASCIANSIVNDTIESLGSR